MNKDQILGFLRKVAPEVRDYNLILTGKESRKVDGLYKPETREILLHNKNYKTDHQAIYTAIHELAHHIHFTGPTPPKSTRSHTTEFWNIFHGLLRKAESIGIYAHPVKQLPELEVLAKKIKEDCLIQGSQSIKLLGRYLNQAMEICNEQGSNFEDFLDRYLAIPRNSAKFAMKAFSQDLPTETGPDGMRVLSKIKDPVRREQATEEIRNGFSLDMLKARISDQPSQSLDNPKQILEKEKQRITSQLQKLQKRLDEIEKELENDYGQ